MNFKTPFKVLTTAALIGTLSLSAVAPGAASAASTVNKVSTKAEADQPTTKIEKIIITKDNKDYTIDRVLYNQLLDANDASVKDATITAVVAADGTYYTREAYSQALAATDSVQEAFAALEEIAKTNPEVLVETIPGSIEIGEGGVEVKDPTETPDSDFKVTEIAAITENGVTVNFPKLTADKEGVTVEVKDSKGNVVAVEPLDLSAGEETAEFAFKTPVKSEDLTGTWTVDGQQIDLSLVKNLAAFEDATAQTAVYKALQDLGIENLTSDNAASYASKKADFLDDLAKEDKELTKEAVQAFVDKVNTDSLTGEEEAKIVKALVAAKGNNVKIAEVLSNTVFKQVNSSWVEVETDGYAAKFNLGTNIDEDSTIAEVQAEIDEANEAQINKEITATFPSESVDKEKLAELQTLIDTYAPVDEDGNLVDTIGTIKTAVEDIKEQSAVADVLAATTASKLKTAVSALATIVDDKAVLDASKYVDANGKAYIDTIKDLNSSTPKLTAADYGVTDKINTVAELGTLITKVNTLATDAAATKLVDAIKTAATNYIATPNTTNQGKLVTALQAAGLKEVSTDKANKDAYSETDNSTKTLDLILAATAPNTTADEAKAALATIQAKIDAANIAVVDAADKDGIVAALAVIGTKNVVSANAQAYVAAVDGKATKPLIQTAVDAANTEANVTAAVKAINEATDAAGVKAGLDTLADNGKITDYLDVTSADRIFIAEQVLKAREAIVADNGNGIKAKEFKDDTKVNAALTPAIETRTGAIAAINDLEDSSSLSDVAKALLVVGHESLTGEAGTVAVDGTITGGAPSSFDTAIAERFQNNLKFDDTTNKVSPKFKSISDIRNAIAAAK